MSNSPATPHTDPMARYPETTTFMVLVPDEIMDDIERLQDIAEHMEAAFPEAVFEIVQSRPVGSTTGYEINVPKPYIVPLVGQAGEGADEITFRRRPSNERMGEIQGALDAFMSGAAALN